MQNVQAVFFDIHKQFLGPNHVARQAAEEDRKLQTTHYDGERKEWEVGQVCHTPQRIRLLHSYFIILRKNANNHHAPLRTHSSPRVLKGIINSIILVFLLIDWLIMTTNLDLLCYVHSMLFFLIYLDMFELIFFVFLLIYLFWRMH